MTIITCGVLTISDKGARGERQDTSGEQLQTVLTDNGFSVKAYEIVPDQKEIISKKLSEWADSLQLDLIITTGGTGVDPSDVTPEATQAIIDREIPGISETMRHASFKKTPHAILSRGISGIRRQTLIINLPGSKKAAQENLEVVLAALTHAIYKIKGGKEDCGR